MRELWVKINPSIEVGRKERLIKESSKYCSTYIVDPRDIDLARGNGAGRIATQSEDGDIRLIDDLEEAFKVGVGEKPRCVIVEVKAGSDEERIVKLSNASIDYIIVKCRDWKVIPLENLIARISGRSKLLALVSNDQEAKIALETLEIGVDGVVVEAENVESIERIYRSIANVKSRRSEIESSENLILNQAEVVDVKPLGLGARACIDTCDLMRDGEGLLVGCQSSGLFLVQAEIYENPFVPPRPFRVNAGSIALYVLSPGNKTRYISELHAGDEVLIVDRHGRYRTTNVCRVKIEWRPLIMIEAEHEGKRFKTILQNAETIRVVTADGTKSVSELRKGDKILLYREEGGRHFGSLVKEEKVIEK